MSRNPLAVSERPIGFEPATSSLGRPAGVVLLSHYVAAPDSYTPKHLAERIINSKAALERERKFVTSSVAPCSRSTRGYCCRSSEDARGAAAFVPATRAA